MSFEDEDGNEEYILWSDLLSAAEKLRRQVSVDIRLYPYWSTDVDYISYNRFLSFYLHLGS